jgi:ribosomal protein L11 methyltransferase
MQWLETKIVFEAPNRALAFELISNAFFDMGLKGIVQEDPDLQPTEGWVVDAPKPAVLGYFADNAHVSARCAQLEQALNRLPLTIELDYQILYRRLDEEDWAHSWKAFYHPVKVSERIVIKPTWQNYTPEPNEIVLEVDPGMAFGTGTHPTTALCIRLIERYLKPGQSLLDIGTGSGILMVAAARLGADQVTGIDIDDVAVPIAQANLQRNQISSANYSVFLGDLTMIPDSKFDLVVANILSDVIIDLLDNIPTLLHANGIFICSGIITPQTDQVQQKMTAAGIPPIETVTREEWVAIVGQYQNN